MRCFRFRSLPPSGDAVPMRAPGRGAGLLGTVVMAVILQVLGPTGGVQAQGEPAVSPQEAPLRAPAVTVELTRSVRRELRQIQDQWLQWSVAFQADQPERAERLVESLMAQVEQLGLKRLPDLAVSAALLAVEAAREEDFLRAEWALQAAERFDPGRPETSLARAEVNRLQEHPLAVLESELEGYGRIFSLPLGRGLATANLLIWALAAALGAGALFVLLQMAVKGRSLGRDLEALLRRGLLAGASGLLASWTARLLALALLLWPLLLPSGLLWLLLWWSALLVGYGSSSERVVLAALWLLMTIAPWVIEGQRQRVELMLSPPVRALDNIEEKRLYGALFSDVGQLLSLLPGDPAVEQLLGDIYRDLGQWESAKRRYLRVLEMEPQNSWAMVALGSYYFIRRDFGKAREYYQQAAEADPGNVVAYYDLSQAYSESYLFPESRKALQSAQQIDDLAVSRLLQQTGDERIFTFDGGVARTPEIRRRLAQLDRLVAPPELILHQLKVLLIALGGAVVAALIFSLLRKRAHAELPSERPRFEALDRFRRALVPGLSSARDQWGGRAYLALLVPVALLLLPVVGFLGYPLGVRVATQESVLGYLVAIVLTGYFGIRLWLELVHPA